jgi:hypothetical protein
MDELITRRLREALALIDVRVLDHLIVAESIYSFAESGTSVTKIRRARRLCRARSPHGAWHGMEMSMA